jgi:hypothetical protein
VWYQSGFFGGQECLPHGGKDGQMQWVSRVALAAWMASAGIAAAQIPRDPLADSIATPTTASSSDPRQLPAPFVTKQSEVEIPFSVRAGSTPQSQPTSVRIFVSWDRGKTWHFYDERKPEDARFKFRPRQDGEFWFATQTIDQTGRPDSPEPRAPQLRLLIDTQRPQLLVQANVDGSGNVQLSWSAADATLAPASLKLEYQDSAGNGGPWQPIEFPAQTPAVQLTGQTTFRPAVSSRTINLRAEIADSAGNFAYFSQKLSLHPPKPKAGNSLAQAPAPDPSATRWPTENPHIGPSAAPQLAADATTSSPSTSDEEVRIPNLVANPYVGPGRLASSRPAAEHLPPPPAVGNNSPASESQQPIPAPQANNSERQQPLPNDWRGSQPVNDLVPVAQSPAPSYDTLPMQRVNSQPLEPTYGSAASRSQPSPELTRVPPSSSEIMPAPQPAESVEPPTAQRPRLTNSRRFSLDYDVQTVGPEGLSAVELWGTSDGGRTWTKWGVDPDKASPFDVEVNHEAVYGFRIVVVGKNGLATTTPQAGEAADIWVGVDLTRPTAKLTGAMYGQGEAAGKLDIRWQASEQNLGSRPISLAIGDRPDGPFTPIAAGLPNTGQYFWEYDPRSPRQIYLRLEVRDEAGNVAIDQLSEPIKVEGLEPKGQIRGFSVK